MKKISLNLISLLLLTIFSPFSNANEMYKWVDDEGNITYSDQPPFKDAKKIDPPEVNTTPAIDVPSKAAAEEEPEEKDTQYSFLKISSPENDATIRNNEGNFSATISMKPSLDTKQGHTMDILLDGTPLFEKHQSTSVSFQNIDRGTHTISAIIKNSKGKTLKTAKPVTIHLHRQSILRKTPR